MLIAVVIISNSPLFLFILFISNLIQISNIYILLYKYPQLLYGLNLVKNDNHARETLIKIVMEQSYNMKLIQESEGEANIILNSEFSIQYFNTIANDLVEQIYGRKMLLDEDFRSYLDEKSKLKFVKSFNQCLLGKQIQVEERFYKKDKNEFTWLKINYKGHYDNSRKFLGISIGITVIDTLKKMKELENRYHKSLDDIAWRGSHILRAPIANMMGILNIMNKEKISLTIEEKKLLELDLMNELDKLDSVVKEMVKEARKNLEK